MKGNLRLTNLFNALHVGKGNITATIMWFAATTDATAGPSYYKEKDDLFLPIYQN